MQFIGALLAKIDGFFSGLGARTQNGVLDWAKGPAVQSVLFFAVLWTVGASIVISSVLRIVDRVVGWTERVLIVAATLAMTALVFNSYLIEQASVLQWDTTVEQPADSAVPAVPDATPVVKPAPQPTVAPEPTAPFDPTADLQVEITGDGTQVTFTSDAGEFSLPGSVPPGTYQTSAVFPGQDAAMQTGEVDLKGPGPVEVKCSSFAETCRVRKRRSRPKPAPRASGDLQVELTGDGTLVTLTSDAGEFTLPGQVPPGTYNTTALFPGQDASMQTGEVDLKGPGPIEVKCSSFAETCRVRKRRPGATPAPVVSGDVQVDITGDGTQVTFISDAGQFTLPGNVPAGTYQTSAVFPGQDAAMQTGEVEVKGPGPIEVKCSSFAETCRVRKKRKAPPKPKQIAPAKPTAPAIKLAVTVRGDGTEHRLEMSGLSTDLPGEVIPGSYIIYATFPDVGEVVAGDFKIDVGDTSQIYCTGRTLQCLPDSGWYNPWRAEGQVNIALMMMVALGFLGASVATQEGNHLAVDAVERVLTRGSAKFVKRVTALAASGFCFIMMNATWAKITSPEASGDTFPGAKVWWWMVEPINAVTMWMPGDKFGPGTEFAKRSAWEAAKVAEGNQWPYGLAFETVGIGSGFPMWIPLLLLVAAFGIMGVRFGSQVLRPVMSEEPTKPKPGTRRPIDVVLAGAFPGAIITLGLAVWLGQGWMIIVAALLLVFMGAPLFIGVGVGTLAGWMLIQDASATALVSDMFEATKKQEIIAIPFFVLAGNLMTHGSIAKRLIDFARAIVGPVPGGLAVAGVVACGIFAAISGSSPATVIAIGSILFPMLVKQGYSEKFSLGLLTTSGGLGIIIPPSVPMIIFAVMVSNPSGIIGVLSPTELFLGGFAPGLLIAGMLIVYTMLRNWPRPGKVGGPMPPGVHPDDDLSGNYGKDLLRTSIRGFLALMLPVLVLGGIYGHYFGSPFSLDVTQAAAFAVVYALVVELVFHRELKFKDVPKVCIETASMIGSLFLILIIAISLNKLLAELEVPQAAAEMMLFYADDPVTFLLLVNVFLLALGCVMDIVSAILIVAPLLAPIAAQYGIHPVHFGIMFIVNLELGYLTPPMGINLFVASTTFKRSLIKVIRGVAPFLVIMLASLMIIIWVPRWSHWTIGPVPGLPALLSTQLGTPQVSSGPRTSRELGRVTRGLMKELHQCTPRELSAWASTSVALTIAPTGELTSTVVSDPVVGDLTCTPDVILKGRADSKANVGTPEEACVPFAPVADCLVKALKQAEFDTIDVPEGATGVTLATLPLQYVP